MQYKSNIIIFIITICYNTLYQYDIDLISLMIIILLFSFFFFYTSSQLQLISPILLCSTISSFPWQCPGIYLSVRFLLILLCGQPGQQSQQFGKFSFSFLFFFFFFFFLLIVTRSGRLAEIRWSVCISKSQRSFCISFSKTNSGLCIYILFIWPNFNF